MSLFELRVHRELHEPVLIVCMEGWIDAGFGAASAAAHLLGTLSTDVMAVFDGDELIDHRARRPTVRIVDGVNSGVSWPEIQLRVGHDEAGSDFLALVGPEPDMRWHAFTRAVVGMCADMHVRLVCGLGAFPASVPHTRPARLAATATDAELAKQVGYVAGTIDVPGGIMAALEEGFRAAGIPAVGLWARVPHYVAGMPYPAATAALLEGLAALTGLIIEVREVHAAAALTAQRIDSFISNSEEHQEMVRRLEASVDAEEAPAPLDLSNLPSGDEIAAELERFLRGET